MGELYFIVGERKQEALIDSFGWLCVAVTIWKRCVCVLRILRLYSIASYEARVAVQCSYWEPSLCCTLHSHTLSASWKESYLCLLKVKWSRSYRPLIYAHPYCQTQYTKSTYTVTIIWLKSFYKRHKILTAALYTAFNIEKEKKKLLVTTLSAGTDCLTGLTENIVMSTIQFWFDYKTVSTRAQTRPPLGLSFATESEKQIHGTYRTNFYSFAVNWWVLYRQHTNQGIEHFLFLKRVSNIVIYSRKLAAQLKYKLSWETNKRQNETQQSKKKIRWSVEVTISVSLIFVFSYFGKMENNFILTVVYANVIGLGTREKEAKKCTWKK